MASPQFMPNVGRVLRSLALFTLGAVPLWFLFDYLWVTFPYIRNGTRIIVDAKLEDIERGRLFPKDEASPFRVVFFGHSRVLAGFQPDLFDKLSAGKVSSYNLGLPGEERFVEAVESMVRGGTIPTHVFLLLAWPPEAFEPTIWKWFDSDKPIIEAMFPFRSMPRDFFVFLALSRQRGGIEAFYNYGRQSVIDMRRDRGYYFIEGGALFPDHRLPADFTSPSDDPTRVAARDVYAKGPYFARLQALAQKHGFRYYLVPSHYREQACAPAPSVNEATEQQLANHPEFAVIGPDYYRYPNKLFSDPVHLNREGAELYTTDLWNQTKQLFD